MGTTWSTCRHLQFQKVSIETQEEELEEEEEEEQEEEGEGEEGGTTWKGPSYYQPVHTDVFLTKTIQISFRITIECLHKLWQRSIQVVF